MIFSVFSTYVFADSEQLILSPYPGATKETSTQYNYVDYQHMRNTDRKTADFSKLISGKYSGFGYELKRNGVHYSQVLKSYADELIKSGYKIHVNCLGESCGDRLLKRFAGTDSYRYNAYKGLNIYNDKKLGIITASKIEGKIESAIMLAAKQDYKQNVKIAYEQITSTEFPKADIKIKKDYKVTLLDYSKLKANKKDAKGAQDHPLITRFPSAYISKYSVIEFEQYPLILDTANKPNSKKSISGKITTLNYEMDKKLSPLLVWRNYEQALLENDIDIIFQCQAKKCGDHLIRNNYDDTVLAKNHDFDFYNMNKKSNYYFFSAVKKNTSGDIYLSGYIHKLYPYRPLEMTIDIIETRPLTKVALNVKSDELSQEIKSNGRVSLYGIEFDYDKASLKKGASSQLSEIAKFLKSNENISIYVVGHTDNKGSYQYNQTLSEKRANTIVNTLSKQYQIKSERLHAVGIGPVAPDAANNNVQNMQKNRRVELVLKSPLYL